MPSQRPQLRRYFCLLISAFCLCASGRKAVRGQSEGAVYYVSPQGDDANPGTRERPWRHIEWAMTRPYVAAGDTIRIRGGVYRPIAEAGPRRDSVTDEALIRPTASGERGRPIAVMAEPGESVLLSGRFLAASWEPVSPAAAIFFHDYTTPSVFPFDHPFQVTEDGRLLQRVSSLEKLDRPGQCFVDPDLKRIYVWTTDGRPPSAHQIEYGGSTVGIEFLGGVRYWRLAGLRLAGFRTAAVIVRGRAGGIELDRMDISYVGANRPGADLSSGYALAIYDTSGGNYIHDSNLHHTLAEAVHISQTGAGGDLLENNDIHENGGAEWLTGAQPPRPPLFGPGLIIRGNRIAVRANRVYANGYHGLVLESDLRGSEGPAAPSENILEGNVFAFNAGNGIYADGKNAVTAALANIVRFNLFDRNNQSRSGSSGDAELRLTGNFDETLVYNNTAYSEKANGLLVASGKESSGTAQGGDAFPDGTRMFNNIVELASRAASIYPLRILDAGPEFAVDYNNWFRPAGGPLVSSNGVEFSALEDFRSKSGQERRGLSLDPRFVSPDNSYFWLRAISPMIGRGLADIRGDGSLWAGVQAGAPPDLGAFPYRPLLAVSATEVVFATAGRSPAAQSVEIRSAAGKPIEWTARAGEPWIRVSEASGATPAALAISVAASGLSAGTYRGSVQVAPALDGEPPLVIHVTLHVLPSPARRR